MKPKAIHNLGFLSGVFIFLVVAGGVGTVVYIFVPPMVERHKLDAILRELEKEADQEDKTPALETQLPGEAGKKFIQYGSKAIPNLLLLLEHRNIRVREKAFHCFQEITGQRGWRYQPNLYPDVDSMLEIKRWWDGEQERLKKLRESGGGAQEPS